MKSSLNKIVLCAVAVYTSFKKRVWIDVMYMLCVSYYRRYSGHSEMSKIKFKSGGRGGGGGLGGYYMGEFSI